MIILVIIVVEIYPIYQTIGELSRGEKDMEKIDIDTWRKLYIQYGKVQSELISLRIIIEELEVKEE